MIMLVENYNGARLLLDCELKEISIWPLIKKVFLNVSSLSQTSAPRYQNKNINNNNYVIIELSDAVTQSNGRVNGLYTECIERYTSCTVIQAGIRKETSC